MKIPLIALGLLALGSVHAQAWRDCIPDSIGPGGCDSIGPGGGQSIGPGGGQSIGHGGGLAGYQAYLYAQFGEICLAGTGVA